MARFHFEHYFTSTPPMDVGLVETAPPPWVVLPNGEYEASGSDGVLFVVSVEDPDPDRDGFFADRRDLTPTEEES